MVKGIKLTQYVYKDDDTDATIVDAYGLFDAFVVACRDRALCSGGEVRLVDEEGVVLAGGFRSGRGGPQIHVAPKLPRRPSPYVWSVRGKAIEEMSGDEARKALQDVLEKM